jgi:hypothetical protein
MFRVTTRDLTADRIAQMDLNDCFWGADLVGRLLGSSAALIEYLRESPRVLEGFVYARSNDLTAKMRLLLARMREILDEGGLSEDDIADINETVAHAETRLFHWCDENAHEIQRAILGGVLDPQEILGAPQVS